MNECSTCGKSPAAIIGENWYCPDCVQLKYKWFIVVAGDIPQTLLFGPFPDQVNAERWAIDFLDKKYSSDWQAVEVIPPDFS